MKWLSLTIIFLYSFSMVFFEKQMNACLIVHNWNLRPESNLSGGKCQSNLFYDVWYEYNAWLDLSMIIDYNIVLYCTTKTNH